MQILYMKKWPPSALHEHHAFPHDLFFPLSPSYLLLNEPCVRAMLKQN